MTPPGIHAKLYEAIESGSLKCKCLDLRRKNDSGR